MLAGAAALFTLVLVLFVLVIRRPGWGSRVPPARWIVLAKPHVDSAGFAAHLFEPGGLARATASVLRGN